MDAARDALPDDINALKEALIIERAKALEVTAELAVARAKASEDVALIAQQKLRIAKLERQVYGQRSERSARLIDQLALEFEELEAGATEDELAAEAAVTKTTPNTPPPGSAQDFSRPDRAYCTRHRRPLAGCRHILPDAPVLRHGRHRGERSTQSLRQERDRAVAHRDRGRAPYRRAVRDRAIHQWQGRRGAPGRLGREL